MTGRTLAELGLADTPRDHPLTYPGAWPADSGLLHGDRMLPLERLVYDDRMPELAVGSNACPGHLRYKMAAFGIDAPVPMVRTRVTGLDVGVSGHVSLSGYISASPVKSPYSSRELFVIWLDRRQLEVVDASEPHYWRVALPAQHVRIELPDGAVLSDVHAYVNRHGVLRDGCGAPRRHPGQRALPTELLLESAPLRKLFGSTPEEFVSRVQADPGLSALGTRLFAEQGWLMGSGLEPYPGPS
ncbi:hypothetical protein [Streptomyces sp. CoH27]|uniref:hypothetical protein n=1 Tax=Streptomyces sp. CoH27 TaxID=2875763 RepID=UPI001CD6D292|nr:hypothetical protein [Streptomyces sp. CoH27]